MKTMKFQKMMVLVLAAAAWAGCTQENPVVTEEQHTTVQFTATLEGKGGEATKALSSDGTATWAENEEIAVYYTTSSGHATATATVTSVTDGKATITATLTDAISGSATLVYPASLHDGSGWLDVSQLYNNQYGNLTDGTNPISTKFDAAIGTGTISVNGGTAVIDGSVSMVNQLAICAFSLVFGTKNGELFNASKDLTMTASAGLTIQCAGTTYQITSDRASNSVSIGGGASYRGFKSDDIVYVAMLPYVGTVTLYSSVSGYNSTTTYTYTTGSGTLKSGAFYSSIPVTLAPGEPATPSGYLVHTSGTISGSSSSTIYLADGADVTLSGATISVTSGPAIQCLGDATITLAGSNTVSTSADGYPAIQAGPSGTTLTIQGSGSLTATGGDYGAGIGSGEFGTCGDITISGGTVTATGGKHAAGIGSGNGTEIKSGAERGSFCGDITISGGTVTATGGEHAAGIGSGWGGKFSSITITSGITSVKATMGEDAQAPIGRGNADQNSGSVTIDETTSWTAGEATTNLNWSVTNSGKTWTLTPITTP